MFPESLLCCSCTSSFFSSIFTLSFALRHLPSACKSANITALHKQGAKTNPRTTDLSACFQSSAKVMESIIAVDMRSFLFSNSLISDHQFRIRPSHSAFDMLLLLSQQWMEVLHVRNGIRAILDISRAFDTVYHPALLSKLSVWYFDILVNSTLYLLPSSTPVANLWLSNGILSSPLNVKAGMAQGSFLCPHSILNLHK